MDSLTIRFHNNRNVAKWCEKAGGNLALALTIGMNGRRNEVNVMCSDEIGTDAALELLRFAVAAFEENKKNSSGIISKGLE